MSDGHSWKVIDTLQRGGKAVCEDRVGVAGPLAWVIDGATPLSDSPLTDGESDAAWLADRLDFHLRRASEAFTDQPLVLLTEHLLRQVAEDAAHDWSHEPVLPPSAALGLVRNQGSYIDYLVLADVTVHVAPPGLTVTDKRVDASTHDAMVVLERELARTHRHEEAMRVVRPALLASRRADMNTSGGYWVASTDPAAAQNALSGQVAIDAGTRLLLCTDGFSRAWDTFAHCEGPDDVLASGARAQEVLNRIREEEMADVQCVSYPRWSVHDDAAALVLAPSMA